MSVQSEKQLLAYALENGLMDMDKIRRDVAVHQRNVLLEQHRFKIWQGETDQRWFTYLPDPDKGRVLKSRKSEEALKDLVADYYDSSCCIPCFPEEYNNWITKSPNADSLASSSVCRYESDFDRFFNPEDKFCRIPICDISADTLESFVRATIKEKKLTLKAYGGLRTLLVDVFTYAKHNGHTDLDIEDFFEKTLKLPDSVFAVREIDETLQIFTLEEIARLADYLWKNPSIVNFGILLQIYSGLRIGELTALKASDNKSEGHLSVRRTESTRPNTATHKKETYIKDFPKTAAGWRTVILPEQGQIVLNHLTELSDGEFLLSENQCRITERKMNYHLQKACIAVGIAPRSSHKIRRTYASFLLSSGVDSAFVKNQMGHTEISTTEKYYHYDIYSDIQKREIVNKLFSF